MQNSAKRKGSESSEKSDAQKSKKPKLASSKSDKKQHTNQNQKPGEGKPKFGKPKSFGDNDKFVNLSAKERRIQAKVFVLFYFIFINLLQVKTFGFGIHAR